MFLKIIFRILFVTSLFAIVVITTGCEATDNNDLAPTVASNSVDTQPVDVDVDVEAYPSAENVEAYPPPSPVPAPIDAYPSVDMNRILIAFDQPVDWQSGTISGVGPAGLTIYIMNITLMGEVVGSGVVDQNGQFAINVQNIQPNVRIGLTANLEEIGLTSEDVRYGDEPMSIPQVGFFYDTTVISE